MILFKILWAVDALASLVVLYFFVIGLSDGTVSSNNMVLWLMILLALAGIMFGSIWLRSHQFPGFASALLFILAIPTLLYFIFILIAMFGNVRWN